MELAIEVGPSSKGGNGMFATRDIPMGEQIIQERPLLVHDKTPESIHQSILQLSTDDHQKLLELSPHNGDVLSILNTNQIMLGSSGLSGVFEKICRINHSCCPNAAWAWCGQNSMERLVAQKHISNGEEICVSYVSTDILLLPSTERKSALAKKWDFDCNCPRCTSVSVSQSDNRSKKLKILNDQALHATVNETCDLQWLKPMTETLHAEGLSIPILLNRVCYDAYQCVLPLCNKDLSLCYLKQALECAKSCPDLADYRKLKKLQKAIHNSTPTDSFHLLHASVIFSEY